jgi:hypothetical protein
MTWGCYPPVLINGTVPYVITQFIRHPFVGLKWWVLDTDHSTFTYLDVFGTACTHLCELLYVLPILKTLTASKKYEGVSRSFWTGRLERELQMVQLSATRCSCIAILWASLVSFVAVTLCVASQRVFIVVSVHFVIDSARKLLDTPS